jgi:putative DNA primase/helicase
LIKRLEIDPHNPQVAQKRAHHGWNEAPFASASSPAFDPAAAGVIGPWPKVDLVSLPFLGPPHHLFTVKNSNGKTRQHIGHWNTDGKHPFLYSFTLWHRDDDPVSQRWMDLLPSRPVAPYSLERAEAFPDAIIVIDDDLFTVDRANQRMIECHASAPPLVFLAWPRGLDSTTPADTDWSQLSGRKILCAVGNDRDSFIHALELNDQLLNVGAGSIEFVLPKGGMDENDGITIDFEGGELRGVRKNIEELKIISKQEFGVSPKNGAVAEIKTVWKPGDGTSSPKENVMMTPWLEKGTITVLYSDPGVGKSWFALLITHALASGGNLVGRFHARNHFHCLYLAGESGDKMCRRIERIQAAMPSSDAADNIEVYPRPGQKVGKLNLERAEDWQTFAAATDKADVIIIDHLTAFTVGRNNQERWSRIHSQLLRYTQQGKTILLLHHANKSGQQIGTIILDADIDQKIHLTKLAKTENGVLVAFEKHRDDETFGKALQPFKLHWDQDADGRLHWWAVDVKPSETKAWAPRPDTTNDHGRSVDEAFILANFKGRKAQIILCLANAILKRKLSLQQQEIADDLHVSKSTTGPVINALIADGIIIAVGNSRARRYALSDVLTQSIIHE